MSKILDSNGLAHFWEKIKALLSGKLDKPATPGAIGQILASDANGKPYWKTEEGAPVESTVQYLETPLTFSVTKKTNALPKAADWKNFIYDEAHEKYIGVGSYDTRSGGYVRTDACYVRSTDATTWQCTEMGQFDYGRAPMAYGDGAVVCGTWESIIYSQDGGETWDSIDDMYYNTCMAFVPNVGFVTIDTSGGVKIFSSDMSSYETVNTGDALASFYDSKSQLTYNEQTGTLLAISKTGKISKSTDGGYNWTSSNLGKSYDECGIYSAKDLYFIIGVKAYTSVDFLSSTDGINWTSVQNAPALNPYTYTLSFAHDDYMMVILDNFADEVYYSLDGTVWLEAAEVTHMCRDIYACNGLFLITEEELTSSPTNRKNLSFLNYTQPRRYIEVDGADKTEELREMLGGEQQDAIPVIHIGIDQLLNYELPLQITLTEEQKEIVLQTPHCIRVILEPLNNATLDFTVGWLGHYADDRLQFAKYTVCANDFLGGSGLPEMLVINVDIPDDDSEEWYTVIERQESLITNAGTENAGKLLGIDEDGWVTPVEAPSNDSSQPVICVTTEQLRSFDIPLDVELTDEQTQILLQEPHSIRVVLEPMGNATLDLTVGWLNYDEDGNLIYAKYSVCSNHFLSWGDEPELVTLDAFLDPSSDEPAGARINYVTTTLGNYGEENSGKFLGIDEYGGVCPMTVESSGTPPILRIGTEQLLNMSLPLSIQLTQEQKEVILSTPHCIRVVLEPMNNATLDFTIGWLGYDDDRLEYAKYGVTTNNMLDWDGNPEMIIIDIPIPEDIDDDWIAEINDNVMPRMGQFFDHYEHDLPDEVPCYAQISSSEYYSMSDMDSFRTSLYEGNKAYDLVFRTASSDHFIAHYGDVNYEVDDEGNMIFGECNNITFHAYLFQHSNDYYIYFTKE